MKNNIFSHFLLLILEIVLAFCAQCPIPEVLSPCYCITDGHIFCVDADPNSTGAALQSLSKSLGNSTDKSYEMFHLENRGLTEINDTFFKDITFSMVYINTASNLSRVATNSLRSLANLTQFHALNSPIANSPPDYDLFEALKRLPNLQIISLYNIGVRRLPANAFSANGSSSATAFSKLIAVSVEASLTSIDDYAFNNLTGLLSINLDKNSLNYIPEYAFNFPVKSAQSLDIELSQNPLNDSSFAIGAFSHINRPFTLWLRFCSNLTTLSEPVFEPILRAGNRISVQSAPLVCDCRLAWLYRQRALYAGLVSGANCANDDNSLFDESRVEFAKC